MALFDENIQNQLKEIFLKLKDDVHVIYFHKEVDCASCAETKEFLTEIAALSDKIKLDIKNFITDQDEVAKYGIDKTPAIVMLDKNRTDFGIRIYGIPSGYEINSFIYVLMELSGAAEAYPADVLLQVMNIKKPVDIKVFVTPTCPHCPGAVITAHKLAHLNANVKAEMIEANTFPALSQKYNVSGVPKIVINETHELLGNQPVTEFLRVMSSL